MARPYSRRRGPVWTNEKSPNMAAVVYAKMTYDLHVAELDAQLAAAIGGVRYLYLQAGEDVIELQDAGKSYIEAMSIVISKYEEMAQWMVRR